MSSDNSGIWMLPFHSDGSDFFEAPRRIDTLEDGRDYSEVSATMLFNGGTIIAWGEAEGNDEFYLHTAHYTFETDELTASFKNLQRPILAPNFLERDFFEVPFYFFSL